jgi:hypothetical protein
VQALLLEGQVEVHLALVVEQVVVLELLRLKVPEAQLLVKGQGQAPALEQELLAKVSKEEEVPLLKVVEAVVVQEVPNHQKADLHKAPDQVQAQVLAMHKEETMEEQEEDLMLLVVAKVAGLDQPKRQALV